MTDQPLRRIDVDLGAVTKNIRHLIETVAPARVLSVVKSDGYGHGAAQVAAAAIAGGATTIGVVDLGEAIALRQEGIDAEMLCWMHDPDEDFVRAKQHNIEVALSYPAQLVAAATAGLETVQFKLDTGLSRNGATPSQWPELFALAARLQQEGGPRVRGLLSHLSGASHADDLQQVEVFQSAIAEARRAGLDPEIFHIAATAGALDLPEARFNQVRIGLGSYGLSPFDDRTSAQLGLTPAMRVSAKVAQVKRVPADSGLSYGYLYRTSRETTLALIPMGYADGVPRIASGAPVHIRGQRYRVSGRIAMDQFIVDVGDAQIQVGDEAVLFGNPALGEPSVEEWAEAAQTINYEVVTRMGNRPVRVYR